MTVQELIDELSALPPDMPVAFPEFGGTLCLFSEKNQLK